MRNFKDLMKVSAVGVILLSALAACNSKPESNPTPPSSDDGQLEVIIEQVVDGKVVDTRAVGRTDVVKYTGKTDGKDVAQIGWPDDVKCNKPFDFIYWAKPGLKPILGGYRFDQTSPLVRTVEFDSDTYDQEEAIKQLNQKLHCEPNGNKTIYVRLEYENINNPNVSPDYDYMLRYKPIFSKKRYEDYTIRHGVISNIRESKASGYVVTHEFQFIALRDNPKPLKDVTVSFGFNPNLKMQPRHIYQQTPPPSNGEGEYYYTVRPLRGWLDKVSKYQVLHLSDLKNDFRKKGDTNTYKYWISFDREDASTNILVGEEYFVFNDVGNPVRGDLRNSSLRWNYANPERSFCPLVDMLKATSKSAGKIFVDWRSFRIIRNTNK